jgi:hypothetical protein
MGRVVGVLLLLSLGMGADDVAGRASALETGGDALAARDLLRRAAGTRPRDPAILLRYAEFLERYGDPEARHVYAQALGLLEKAADRGLYLEAIRRLALLDLLAGEKAPASALLRQYRAAGGDGWGAPPGPPAGEGQPGKPSPSKGDVIQIPGPLGAFARMAAISSDSRPDDILPALARNVVTSGYRASSNGDALEPTEFLDLIAGYLSQARELERVAGPGKTIHVPACDSAEAGRLLPILGYRLHGGCGSEAVLETADASRAFLTIDSGFPLASLEQAFRANRPFVYDFKPTEAPVLYGAAYWVGTSGEFLDVFLSDPALCRLYLGLSRLNRPTAEAFRRSFPLQRLKVFAHVLDFFGGMFEIEDGKAVVPGGPPSAAAWAEIAGAPPDRGAAFFEHLISKDDGWAASYYDALARLDGPVRDYLASPARLKRFYSAIRGKVTSPGPARPIFPSNTEVMLLTTRLRLDPDGRPHIPGGVELWGDLLSPRSHGKATGLTKPSNMWQDPDDVLEALFALSRKLVDNQPLRAFMALSDLDRHRNHPLAPATVARLARSYGEYGAQYPLFGEAPALDDRTILRYLDVAHDIGKISDPLLRADAAGTLQALAGLWQIFCRHGSIPEEEADAALSAILTGFGEVRKQRDLFDSARNGVLALLQAGHSPAAAGPQDRVVGLLASGAASSDSEASRQVARKIVRLFDAQRLVSLNLLFDLAGHLESLSRGEKLNAALLDRLASRIGEIRPPRDTLTPPGQNFFPFGYWAERHLEAQRKLNLPAAIEKASSDPEKLRDIRGLLAPLLRDTLVGFNYIEYAPPGGQLLSANPVFVRTHDFLGLSNAPETWRNTTVRGIGWPSNASGGLTGSLAGLPYALAAAEQNFMVPAREQSLIWGDLAPQIVLTATVPRWWNVTPVQLHWVGLHMRYAKSLLAESSFDRELRRNLLDILKRRMEPVRIERIGRFLEQGDVPAALDTMAPAELFFLATQEDRREDPLDPLASEIRRMAARWPDQVRPQAISRAFGSPKPILADSYRPELLSLRPFPALMNYSSRIMGESWESSGLYWATLADEMHLPPSQLNVKVPEWTEKMVETVYASHLEDWPALLVSLRAVGSDLRAHARHGMASQGVAAE